MWPHIIQYTLCTQHYDTYMCVPFVCTIHMIAKPLRHTHKVKSAPDTRKSKEKSATHFLNST